MTTPIDKHHWTWRRVTVIVLFLIAMAACVVIGVSRFHDYRTAMEKKEIRIEKLKAQKATLKQENKVLESHVKKLEEIPAEGS